MSDINVTVQDEIVNIDVLDTPVLVNVVNSPGQQGPAGPGVPVGGITGQVLKKLSATNYDTYWAADAAGVSSVGLSMPSAFSVANSPITSSGTLAVTGSGSTTQYIDGTGALQTFPLTLPVLQEVRNQTGATLAAGTVVYINGATGNKPTVTKAIATGDATSAQTLGMISAAIANNGVGYVVVIGTCGGLDTSAFTEGQQLYLSYTTAGAVTTTKPYAPNHLVYVGIVTRSHPNLGTIEVRVQNGFEMDEIHNVSAQTPSNNDGLFYNTTTSLWENKSIATVLGYTPEQPLTFNSPLSRAGNVVSIPQATGSVNGFLSATDWTTFNNKQAALGFTPANAATTLTINGVTFDLSANRTWTIAAGISGSGASGQVTYWTGASAVAGSNNLFWDATNNGLVVGSNTISSFFRLGVNGNIVVSGASPYITFNTATNSGSTPAYIQYVNSTSLLNIISTGAIDFYTNANQRMRLFAGGNVLIGSTSDLGVRFGVIGDTLLRGSGATSATTALTVQNSSSTNLFTVRNDGYAAINYNGTSADANAGLEIITTSATATAMSSLAVNGNSATGHKFLISHIGTNSSAYLQNYSTSASNYRGIFFLGNELTFEVTNTNYAARIQALSVNVSGYVGINNTSPTALTDIGASTTARASLRIRSGTAPTTPNDGDIWFDGTNIKMRIGGVTKTFTLI